MADQRNDLPPVSSPNFLEKVREALSTYLGSRGDKLDRGLTVRDLADSGLVTVSDQYLLGGGRRLNPIGGVGKRVVDAGYTVDLTPPPTPTGFTASAAFENILITVDAQTYTQGNGHGRTKLYGSTVPGATFGTAELLMEFQGTVASYPALVGTTYALWATNVTKDGVESAAPAPSNDVYGLSATTAYSVNALVAAQTGAGKPFVVVDTAFTDANGVYFPAGVYAQLALINDAQITNAKIKDTTIDDAKIANLSAAKITAGSIAVGQTISSTGQYSAGVPNWSIDGAGLATFNNAVVRGAVYATSGYLQGVEVRNSAGTVLLSSGNTLQENMFGVGGKINSTNITTYIANAAIGNAQIGGNIQSTDWNGSTTGWLLDRAGNFYANSGTFRGSITGANGTFGGNVHGGQFTTGAYTGYAWPAVNNYGTYLGPSGLLIGNANNSKYFQVTQDGDIYTPGFNVVNGTMTVNQANVVNTINIAGNAVSTMASATGGNGTTTNVFVPSGQTMDILCIAAAPSIWLGGTLVQQTTATLTFGGVSYSETGSCHRLADGTYATDVLTFVRKLSFGGPTTVYASISQSGLDANGNNPGLTLTLFGRMR